MKNILSILFLFLLTIPGIANEHFKLESNTTDEIGHFQPAFINNGINHMNINILGATIGGSSLIAGDEIAAFDGSICVGVLRITDASFSSGSIAASQAFDGLANGYTVGHSITLKFWDIVNSKEYSPVNIYDGDGQIYSPVYTDRGSTFVRLSTQIGLTVQIGAENKTYDGTKTATIPSTQVVITGIKTGHDVSVAVTNALFDSPSAGNGKTVTASLTLSGKDAGYYTCSSTATTTANITARPITLTADAKSKIYGETDPAFTAQVTSGSIISGDIASGSLNRAVGDNVDTYAINKGSYTYGGNYSETFVSANLTIAPKAIQVTAVAKAKTYGESDPTFTYTSTPALIGTDAFTGSLSRVPGENVGTYVLNKNTLALSSNYTINYTEAILTINAKTINVTADAKSKAFGDTDPSLTYTFTPALVSTDVFTGSLNRVAGKNVGVYAINKNNLALNNNYTIKYTGANLTVGAKTINVAADSKTKTFGDADPALTYTYSPGLIGTDAFSGYLSRSSGENAGSYDISQNSLTLNSNYTIKYTGANLVIDPKPITISAQAQSKTYGEVDPKLTYTYIPNLLGTDVFTGSLSRVSGENVGEYDINNGTLSAGSNYSLAYTKAKLTINTKAINVKADAKSKTYGDDNFPLTYTYFPKLIGADTFSGSLGRVVGENVGSYVITKNDLSLSSNYVLNYTEANLTISAKTINVVADSKSKIYGDPPPILTYTYSPQLIGTDTFTGSLSRIVGDDVGSYAITKNDLNINSNYIINYTGANLTINPKPIYVTADVKTKTYGDIDPILTYSFKPALIGNDNFVGSLSRVDGENVGVYTITQNNLNLTGNYTINYTEANLIINPKSIYVTADVKTKTYGEADPDLTYTLSQNLSNNDHFTGTLKRKEGEDIGEYNITEGTLSLNKNYTLIFATNKLTIAKKTINVTANERNKIYGDADPILTYSYTPNLIGNDVFTGSLSRVAGENIGTYTISKNDLALNSNYTINYLGANFTIGVKSINIVTDAKSKTYGDSDPAFTYTFSPVLVGTDKFSGTLSRTSGENVGTYSINIGSLTAGANYKLAMGDALALTITPKKLTVKGAIAQNKVYDGTSLAEIKGATLEGIIGTDVIALANHTTGTFASTNVGTNIPVSTQMTLTGAASTNYTLTQPTDLKANILGRPPIANAGEDKSVDEGNAFTLDGSGSIDLDGDNLTYLWTAPDGITLSSNTAQKPSFTAPEVLKDKTFTFTLVVNDGTSNSEPDQVIITVKQVDKAPLAIAGEDLQVEENTKVTLNGLKSYDPEGLPLVYTWVIPPGITVYDNNIAKIEFMAPEVTTKTAYSFTLIVSDGQKISRDVVIVYVNNVNKKPVANAGIAQTVKEGDSVTLDGSKSSDPDGDAITYLWTEPSGIQLAGKQTANPKFVAPEVTASTTYTFKLTVNDGLLTDESTVVITVENVNKMPIANAGTNQAVKANTLVQLDGSGSKDPDGQISSYLWTAPQEISLSSNTAAKPTFTSPTVTTDKNFLFTLTVNDGSLNSVADTVIVTVNYENLKPIAINQQLSVNEDNTLLVELKATDDKGPSKLTYSITKAPANGTLTPQFQNFYSYTPKADYFGTDKFEFEVKDEDGKTDIGTVLLTINPVNDAPTMVLPISNYSLEQGNSVNAQVTMQDIKDGTNAAKMKMVVETAPSYGKLSGTIEKGSFTYTPNADFSGIDYIKVQAVETNTIEELSSISYTLFFNVSKKNQTPTAFSQQFTILEDSLALFKLSATDLEDGTTGLSYSIIQYPSHGTMQTMTGDTLKYIPNQNYFGYDELLFNVKDKEGLSSNTSRISFNINAVNDRPIALSAELSAENKDSLLIDMSPLISDVETPDNALKVSFQLGKGIMGGTVTNMQGTIFKYKKGTNTKTYDYLLYKVSDENLSSYTQVITIKNIGSLKSAQILAPIAVSDTVDVWYNKPLSIEFIGVTPSEPFEKLTMELLSTPIQGDISGFAFKSYDQAVLTTYRGTYTPKTNKTLLDSVEYKVSGKNGQSTAKLYFKVHKTNIAPDIHPIANQTINEDEEARIILQVDDLDTNVTDLNWLIKNATISGFQLNMTIIAGKQTLLITPPKDYSGTSQINVVCTDQTQLKDSVQFVLTVKEVNDAPTLISEKKLTVNEDEPFEFVLTGYDVDGDAVNLNITNLPAGLTLKKGTNNNAILSGTLGNDLVGLQKLNLELSDGKITVPITFELTVNNTDDPPYVKNPIGNILAYTTDKTRTIDLSKVFADDDIGSTFTYTIYSNTNTAIVSTEISGNILKLNISETNIGTGYIVVYVNSNGKIAQAGFGIEVQIGTGIEDISLFSGIEVYPNPTQGDVYVQFGEMPVKGTVINVHDLTGRLVYKQMATSEKELINLQGRSLGMYFVQIVNGTKSKTFKIVLN